MARIYSSLANPEYGTTPFTDSASVGKKTPLEALNLNWRERDLPERARTKHVHRLHPYLGKFIPQLVEIFLRKYAIKAVCDPFCGSGTTLVEANILGLDAIGLDISEFNCLLSRVKTAQYDVERLQLEIRDALDRLNLALNSPLFTPNLTLPSDNGYLGAWFHPDALRELLTFRGLIQEYQYQDVLRVILSRAARSARLTTHFELDFPKRPTTEPYQCRKHDRICQPTKRALQFLNRYALDTLERIKAFSMLRTDRKIEIICENSCIAELPFRIDTVITSPPYVGLIDYHEQHRYAYELLGLPWRAEKEIGPASGGASLEAKRKYVEGIQQSFRNCARHLTRDGIFVVIVNDRHGLYEGMHKDLEFRMVAKLERHVNRRTGRRSGDFFEQIYIWKRK